jgi:hypothetical protein
MNRTESGRDRFHPVLDAVEGVPTFIEWFMGTKHAPMRKGLSMNRWYVTN